MLIKEEVSVFNHTRQEMYTVLQLCVYDELTSTDVLSLQLLFDRIYTLALYNNIISLSFNTVIENIYIMRVN